MSKLGWYWHRLRAMSPGEMALHALKILRQAADARGLPAWPALALDSPGSFPKLPKPEDAPNELREALQRDATDILAGRWKAFGHLDLQVDDPPKWHKDYLVGKDLATTESAFKLDHRELPGGADIKLIWELSRWHQLTRLAMAAYVLGDGRAASKCVGWLEDWVRHNPPYRGWNWTSALESGMRLVQFTWMDALLGERAILSVRPEADRDLRTRLSALRAQILPAHVWFTWRHKSFGSSANNHLIGELAGLILAICRWPELTKLAAPVATLQRLWEHEVVAQFAEDGGNREQALNYHLFSWELCWQARSALIAVGSKISPEAEERLIRAARFFWEVQARTVDWDYGDSDDAFVLPMFLTAKTRLKEWRNWIGNYAPSHAIAYWIGPAPPMVPRLGAGSPQHTQEMADEWWVYQNSGIALCESGFWWLRWDLSPLGYLKTAAHGHLDALHLSIWIHGVPMVTDPGTGAYYADRDLRTWLASAAAHNGPCMTGGGLPERLGPFLWSRQHPALLGRVLQRLSPDEDGFDASLRTSTGSIRRTITRLHKRDGWEVADEFEARGSGSAEFSVRWQFAPGAWVKRLDERAFRVCRDKVAFGIELGANWSSIYLAETRVSSGEAPISTSELEARFSGTVSPAFRKVEWAPFLKLVARPEPGKPCVFRTTFLACRDE